MARGLPASIVKKYGITKKAWDMARLRRRARWGARARRTPTKKVIRVKRSNPKRRNMPRRRYRKKRRRKSRTVPFEMLMAGAAIPFVPARDGWGGSPVDSLTRQDPAGAVQHLAEGFLGYDMTNNTFDIMAAINPLDMRRARYWKMLFWSAIVSKVRKRVAPQSKELFKRIPLVGRWIS